MRDPGAPFWVPSAALQRHVNRTVSGNPGIDWLSHLRATSLPAHVGRALIVGCGEGHVERALAKAKGARQILGVDADTAAVERARRQAERRGLSQLGYAPFNPRSQELPPGPWDTLFVTYALHHAARPEDLLRSCHDALAPKGRFVLLDYVGPNRFQHPADRMEIVRRYFRLLPERLRRGPLTGRILPRREEPDAAALARALPHEATRSAELLDLSRTTFAEEALLPAGGGLLHPLLSGLEGNFGRDPADDERVLAVLGEAEADASARGLLPDAFALFVGRRRTGATG
ncbi:MAG TPA: class I SAM-dependent methyltransferase [Thermoanaerobaculia bacterium]|nr:class I SAM-dependent methyltransferase [Thermoanaerobaculia bacterium]